MEGKRSWRQSRLLFSPLPASLAPAPSRRAAGCGPSEPSCAPRAVRRGSGSWALPPPLPRSGRIALSAGLRGLPEPPRRGCPWAQEAGRVGLQPGLAVVAPRGLPAPKAPRRRGEVSAVRCPFDVCL